MEYAILNSKIPAEGNRDLTSAEKNNLRKLGVTGVGNVIVESINCSTKNGVLYKRDTSMGNGTYSRTNIHVTTK